MASVAGVALSGSKVTLAVLLSKSTTALVTPGTFSRDFVTVIGQTAQVIFFTSSVMVCNVPANKMMGRATRALSKAKRFISNFVVNKTVVQATVSFENLNFSGACRARTTTFFGEDGRVIWIDPF